MSYQKQNFRDGEVLSAEQLNRMEEGIAKLETNMITAEEPAESAEVQSTLESILKSIEDKGNGLLALLQKKGDEILDASAQKGGSTDVVYCWGDSLTEGVGGDVATQESIQRFIVSAYPDVVAKTYPCVNLGCRGETILKEKTYWSI